MLENKTKSITQEIRSLLFPNQDLWKDRTKADWLYPHTNLVEENVSWVLSGRKDVFWLEIGTMLGGSALVVANTAKKKNINIDLLCIDPFTGDVNMWEWESDLYINKQWRFLSLQNGAPTIRQRFLANVFESGYSEIITPIQATGIVGMKLIERLYLKQKISRLPDVIYVDSAHEEMETFLELKTAWSILADSGALMGDDLNWPAVRNDVYKFSSLVEKNLITFGNQWAILK